MRKLIGVYGTLKSGFGNHHCIAHPTTVLLGECKTESKFTMVDYTGGHGYPAVCVNGTTPIHLEVYEVNDEKVLQRVYRLEGYNGERGHPANSFYDTMDVETPWGTAEIFVMTEEECRNRKIIDDGKW